MKITFPKVVAGISLIVVLLILLALYWHFFMPGEVAMLSISSDGRYVISTDSKEWAILWDLKTHHKTTLNRKAHIFSAYFIPNTHDFIWQGQDKVLHFQNVERGEFRTLQLPFYVLGQAMTSDEKNYVAGDIASGLRLLSHDKWITLRESDLNDERQSLGNGDELTADKPYNLSFSPAQDKVLSSGYAVQLWNMNTGKLVRRFPGTVGKTFATLSPDGKYVVAGDEQPNGFVWETTSDKPIVELDDLFFGTLNRHNSKNTDKWTWDKTGLIPMPKDFSQSNGFQSDAIMAIKFIDATHYLRFTTYIPYAILYEVNNPKPLKYFPLGRYPWPAVDYYIRDQAIDTSWQTHTLVMGKENGAGILVYQYDPKKQTLTKIWNGRSCILFC